MILNFAAKLIKFNNGSYAPWIKKNLVALMDLYAHLN